MCHGGKLDDVGAGAVAALQGGERGATGSHGGAALQGCLPSCRACLKALCQACLRIRTLCHGANGARQAGRMLGTSRCAARQAGAATKHSLSGPAGKAAAHLHQGLQLLLAGSLLIVVGGHNDLSGGGQLALSCRAGRHEGQRGREPHSLGRVHVQQSSMAARRLPLSTPAQQRAGRPHPQRRRARS